MLRRLHPEQPASFAFTPANRAWAEAQITKYPEGRQASAVIPLLWRAQEQEGWLTRPAIEHVAQMLGMPYIRALEVATFYFMFQLSPVGSVAHVQVCGTTSCMICGAEDLVAVCRERIAPKPHQLSADGRFSWEEVECLGACANAPMAQIGKDYYEDLSAARLHAILDDLSAGKVPVPGPQNGRFSCEPKKGLTSLAAHAAGRPALNASAALAVEIGDTVKRIDGTEVPLATPWLGRPETPAGTAGAEPKPGRGRPADETGATVQEAPAVSKARPATESATKPAPATAAGTAPSPTPQAAGGGGRRPKAMAAPEGGKADDLKLIRGVGPKLEGLLHSLGIFHFAQIAGWTDAELAWIDENLEGFKGRAGRDGWIAQARVLASGGQTEFSAKQDGKDG